MLKNIWNLKDIPAGNNNGDITDFNGANATYSLNFKTKITGQTDNGRKTKNVEIMVPLRYLSNFWRTLETLLINCEVNLILNWPANCVIVYYSVASQGVNNVASQDIYNNRNKSSSSRSYFTNSR